MPNQRAIDATAETAGRSATLSPVRAQVSASLVRFAVLTGLYFVTGKASLELASLHESASPVWPPSGIALAAVLLYGHRVWPAIFLGAFLVNASSVEHPLPLLGIAAGNTLEALLGGWLVGRMAQGRRALETASNVLRFVFFAALLAPVVSATVGVGSLALAGLATWERSLPIWVTWWTGDMVGVMVVTPFLLAWSRARFRERQDLGRAVETLAAVAVTALVAAVAFGGLLPGLPDGYPIAFVCFPPLLWPVFRLGRPGVAAALLAVACVALLGTLRSNGPFAQYELNTSLLLLQSFIATMVVMNLVLAALVGERRRVALELGLSQKALRSQLHEIEDLYRTAPVGLCLLDHELRFLRINAYLAEINGLPVEAHIGRTVREVVPDLAARAERSMREVLATGRPMLDHEIEGETAALPGVKRQWLESFYPVVGVDGLVSGISCVVREVTAIKEAEESLRVQRRLQDEAEAHLRVEAEVAAAVENERRRLGQELHEGLGQELTGISYLMATLYRALRGSSSEQAQEAMRLEGMVSHSIERTRSLAKAFYPVEMETLGLIGSLEEMAYNAAKSFDIQCHVRADADTPAFDLRGPVGIQLFRIAQEAIYYEVKHGESRRIDISVNLHDEDVVLTVTGDGEVRSGDLDETNGPGLRMMRYRAGIIGGVLDVRSPRVGGTIVRCSAPMPVSGVLAPH